MFPLKFCEAIVDTICPAWRRELKAEDATLFYTDRHIYDKRLGAMVINPCPPEKVKCFNLERQLGLVQSVVCDSYPWHFTTPALGPSDILIQVTVDGTRCPVPGRSLGGSTQGNLRCEINDLIYQHGFGCYDVRLVVGTQEEVEKDIQNL